MTTTLMTFATRCHATLLSAYSVIPFPPHRLSEAEVVVVIVEEVLTLSPSTLWRIHHLREHHT